MVIPLRILYFHIFVHRIWCRFVIKNHDFTSQMIFQIYRILYHHESPFENYTNFVFPWKNSFIPFLGIISLPCKCFACCFIWYLNTCNSAVFWTSSHFKLHYMKDYKNNKWKPNIIMVTNMSHPPHKTLFKNYINKTLKTKQWKAIK